MLNLNVVYFQNDQTFDQSGVSYSLQVFNMLYAYRQYLNAPDYISDWNIEFNTGKKDGYFNILFAYMPEKNNAFLDLKKQFDLVILDNGCEPLGTVSVELMKELIQDDDVFLMGNSFFTRSKSNVADKSITLVDDLNNYSDYTTRPFFPQYYNNIPEKRNKGVCYVNGENRAHRHHLSCLLKEYDSTIHTTNNISKESVIHATLESNFEDEYDTEFRETLNRIYPVQWYQKTSYYDNKIMCGINGGFGSVPPGYFMMPEFLEYKLIAFPEGTWINDEIEITEKALKCLYYESLPFPIGGVHTHVFYNELGFKTGWDLLPDDLKTFDSEYNHFDRYQKIAIALAWLNQNKQILETDRYTEYVKENKKKVVDIKNSKHTVKKLSDIIIQKQSKKTTW